MWLQEAGAPAPLIGPQEAARFTEATVVNALDCPDLWGVTWWCSHDVSRELADFPELEYGLGLLTNDGRTKPAGAALARIAEEWGGRVHRPAARSTALAVDVGGAEDAPGRSVCAPGGAFFDAWTLLTARGARPAVVRAERAEDRAHLAARGITEVLRVRDVL